MRWLPRSRWGVLRVLVLVSLLPALFLIIWLFTVKMPGRSFAGALPPLSPEQQALRVNLERHVRALAGDIGERSARTYPAVLRAGAYITETLTTLGYEVAAQEFAADDRAQRNLEATLLGADTPAEIVVVGAHYDTALDAPGADDNASGVAAVLELARVLAGARLARTVRFVAFATEEPPYFPSVDMGSRHYADAARARGDTIVAMVALESIGYYDPAPGTQRYPFPLNLAYPDHGDFIGFVSNLRSRTLLRRALATFRAATPFPSQGAAAPGWLPGVWWSDHWSFWRQRYPAIMITCTAPYRNPFYHTPHDTPDKLDYARMARVMDGVTAVVRDLAGAR
jgi:Zn-dependent M28 family amino/carboxypeptidase